MNRQPINKDNYEEYFLLYVDNELSATAREAVEQFVEANPGMKEELQMFMDTKLEPDQLTMPGAEALFRSATAIDETNLEEYQLMMLDGELDQEKQKELEAYHHAHPEAAAGYAWLNKAKLEPEHIPFPDKAMLYRRERKPATVISFHWTRVAVAASVILVAGLLWMAGEQGAGGREQIAESRKQGAESRKQGAESREQIMEKGEQIMENGEQNATQSPIAGLPGKLENNNQIMESGEQLKTVKGNSGSIAAANTKKAANNGKLNQAVTRETQQEPQQFASVERQVTPPVEDKPVTTIESTTSVEMHATTASTVAYKTNYISDALNDDDGEEYVEREEDGRQRKGLRGIVRKANRFYNRVTNPDLDKQLVKIANFEIGSPR